MAYRSPIFTAAVFAVFVVLSGAGQAVGQTLEQSSGAGQGGAVTGQQLITEASRRLQEVPLSAKLLHEVNLLGQRLSGGEGSRYSQLGRRSNRMRFELKLGVGGEQIASLVHVCNGEHLYVRRALPGQTKVTRVRVDAVEAAIEATRKTDPNNPGLDWIAIGGLSRFLQMLRSNFEFGPPQVGRFGERQVWIVTGTWRPVMLAQLVPEQRDAILAGEAPDFDGLPPEFPTHVTVALGTDREIPLFPYFIEYRRSAADGKTTPMLTLKFYDVRRRPDLTEADFDYTVTETAEVIDNEDRFIRSLGLQPVR